MRIWALAITAVAAIAISVPASAAKKKPVPSETMMQSFEACEAKAAELGMPHGQAGHQEYVRECMGKRPGNSHAPN
jgi:hypothetical protein